MNEEQMFLPTDEAKAADIRNMEPLEAIKAAAEGIGLILNDPKPNCKKCHGRGYIGRHADTGEPIACSCLFPKFESQREVGDVILPQNRAQRRKMAKKLAKQNANKPKTRSVESDINVGVADAG